MPRSITHIHQNPKIGQLVSEDHYGYKTKCHDFTKIAEKDAPSHSNFNKLFKLRSKSNCNCWELKNHSEWMKERKTGGHTKS